MNGELLVLRDLLLWLWRKGNLRLVQGEMAGKAGEIFDRCVGSYPPIDEHPLSELLRRDEADLLDTGSFIYLEPPRRGAVVVPVLSVKYDLSAFAEELRLRLGLFLLSGQGAPCAIGYRFETPEATDTHRHYHAQLFRSFDLDQKWQLPSCPEWLPETQPAIPVDAGRPISLVVCMLLGLYGPSYLGPDMPQSFRSRKKEFMDQLTWMKAPPRPAFVELTDQDRIPRLPVLSVTADEGPVGGRITQVSFFLQHDKQASFWNGKAWSAGKHPLASRQSGGGWVCTDPLPGGQQLSDGSYLIHARAYNQAGYSTKTSIRVIVARKT